MAEKFGSKLVTLLLLILIGLLPAGCSGGEPQDSGSPSGSAAVQTGQPGPRPSETQAAPQVLPEKPAVSQPQEKTKEPVEQSQKQATQQPDQGRKSDSPSPSASSTQASGSSAGPGVPLSGAGSADQPAPVGESQVAGQGSGGQTAVPKLTAAEAEKKYRQSGEGRGVEVEVTWIAPAYAQAKGNPASQYDPEEIFIFMIAMTTHGGNLLNYDMPGKAVLRMDGLELAPGQWKYTSQDSHHPEGILVFDLRSSALLIRPAQATAVTLVLKDLNGLPERVFTWE